MACVIWQNQHRTHLTCTCRIRSNAKNSAFLYALNTGNSELVQLLLYYDADVNIKNEFDTAALINAANQGYSYIVEILLMHGVDVEQKDNNGHTPLINAVPYRDCFFAPASSFDNQKYECLE